MRRSYASGYSRSSRSEPSLAWFVMGAIAIGVGYLYISSLGDDKEAGAEAVIAEGGTTEPDGTNSGENGGEVDVRVRPAVPVSEVNSGSIPESGSAWMTGSRMVLAWIPGGKYMVRTEEGISTRKFGGGFWMAVRTVEESEYEEVMGANPVPEGKRDPSAPVTRVSWEEAKEYAVQLTLKEREEGKLPSNYEYRIPTEMMWEYAVGGGEDGSAIRVREEDSRDLTWWRINGVEEFKDSNHQGGLRAGSLDVGLVSEWTADNAESIRETIVVRGAPHTAFLGREESVVKSRFVTYHKDERLPFLGFRLIMVRTGSDRIAVEEGTVDPGEARTAATVRPLEPGEKIDYVERRNSFNLEELFETSKHSRDSSLTKYNLLRKVQMELKDNGFYTAKVDGYPGKSTQKAIDKFQAAVGLPKSGRLDDLTLASLGIKTEGRTETALRSGDLDRPAPRPTLPRAPGQWKIR